MTFLEPLRLWILVVPAALLVGYLVAMSHRERWAVRFTNLELLDRVAPERPGWRRHVPAALVLLGLVSMSLAFARPMVEVEVPREDATVVLAIDVSLSMDATDVAPSRIAAAKEAAKRFVELAPPELDIGLVAFSGVAFPVVPPTEDRQALVEAIDRLELGEGTAIGEGIYAALAVLQAATPETPEGEEPARAIVVLSDGETTVGRPDLEAGQAAREAGVPVFTISFGTTSGIVTYQGEVIPVPVNEGALRQVAELTGGQFFQAASEGELRAILDTIGTQIATDLEPREIADWFVLAAIVLVALGATASLVWFSRIP